MTASLLCVCAESWNENLFLARFRLVTGPSLAAFINTALQFKDASPPEARIIFGIHDPTAAIQGVEHALTEKDEDTATILRHRTDVLEQELFHDLRMNLSPPEHVAHVEAATKIHLRDIRTQKDGVACYLVEVIINLEQIKMVVHEFFAWQGRYLIRDGPATCTLAEWLKGEGGECDQVRCRG